MINKFILEINNSLPTYQVSKLRSEPDCYGISRLISSNLFMPFTPISFSKWLHGWMAQEIRYIEEFGIITNEKYLVATKEQENFIKEKGKKAKAIGAPYAYIKHIDNIKIERKKRTLLVMPPHGLSYTKEKWDEEKYINKIKALKKDFEYIVACIHPSCIEKNFWVGNFEKEGVPCIIGADVNDKNALIRMHRLFQHFEYMTTNTIGSHVAYAAYSGCKVSIFGDYDQLSKKDVEDDILYKTYPYLLNDLEDRRSEIKMQNKFPFLFCNPKNATVQIRWASNQLGEQNMLPIYKIPYQLKWWPHQQMYWWLIKIFRKIKNVITNASACQ
jgi:hypothetical protein